MREQVLQYVDQYKIIAIVRGADPKQCFAVAEALYAGGIRLMEVTYDQKKPETWQATADTIGALAKEYEGRMFEGTFDTDVFSMLIRWFEDEIVSTTKKIRTAARMLNMSAVLTMNPEPPLLFLLSSATC